MQTFLPLQSLAESVRVLDRQRLGKQRVEAMQILRALHDPSYGWQRHPAVSMWRGYEDALTSYMNHAILEWVRRGYRNTMQLGECRQGEPCLPPWWGGSIHASHRAALLVKLPEWYSQFRWSEQPIINYVWPISPSIHVALGLSYKDGNGDKR